MYTIIQTMSIAYFSDIDKHLFSIYHRVVFPLRIMQNQTVTNEMLYELLKEFKADMREFKSDVNRRFQEVDKQFQSIDKRLDDITDLLREDKKKLQEVYDSRDKVTVQFTRAWSLASFFIAFGSSALVLILSRL